MYLESSCRARAALRLKRTRKSISYLLSTSKEKSDSRRACTLDGARVLDHNTDHYQARYRYMRQSETFVSFLEKRKMIPEELFYTIRRADRRDFRRALQACRIEPERFRRRKGRSRVNKSQKLFARISSKFLCHPGIFSKYGKLRRTRSPMRYY